MVPTGLQGAEMLWSTLALQEDQVQGPLSGLGTSYPKAGSLAAFNTFSFCLVFLSLVSMCLPVSPRVCPVWDSVPFGLD